LARQADHQRRRVAGSGREAQGVLGVGLRDTAANHDDIDAANDDAVNHDDIDAVNHDAANDDAANDDAANDDAVVHHELDTHDEHVHALGPGEKPIAVLGSRSSR
jgi:hypothetical protein